MIEEAGDLIRLALLIAQTLHQMQLDGRTKTTAEEQVALSAAVQRQHAVESEIDDDYADAEK